MKDIETARQHLSSAARVYIQGVNCSCDLTGLLGSKSLNDLDSERKKLRCFTLSSWSRASQQKRQSFAASLVEKTQCRSHAHLATHILTFMHISSGC